MVRLHAPTRGIMDVRSRGWCTGSPPPLSMRYGRSQTSRANSKPDSSPSGFRRVGNAEVSANAGVTGAPTWPIGGADRFCRSTIRRGWAWLPPNVLRVRASPVTYRRVEGAGRATISVTGGRRRLSPPTGVLRRRAASADARRSATDVPIAQARTAAPDGSASRVSSSEGFFALGSDADNRAICFDAADHE